MLEISPKSIENRFEARIYTQDRQGDTILSLDNGHLYSLAFPHVFSCEFFLFSSTNLFELFDLFVCLFVCLLVCLFVNACSWNPSTPYKKMYESFIRRASPRGDFFPIGFFTRKFNSPGASGSQWCEIPAGGFSTAKPKRPRISRRPKSRKVGFPWDVSQDPMGRLRYICREWMIFFVVCMDRQIYRSSHGSYDEHFLFEDEWK